MSLLKGETGKLNVMKVIQLLNYINTILRPTFVLKMQYFTVAVYLYFKADNDC